MALVRGAFMVILKISKEMAIENFRRSANGESYSW